MFKKPMKVMMIGMIAMLGAETEAHWVVIKGRCYWHSGECVREDSDVPKPDASVRPPDVELDVRVTKVEILCSRGNVEKIDLSANPVILASRGPIVPSDITERIDRAGNIMSRNLKVQRIVSGAYFLENPADSSFCSGLSANDLIIREMDVDMNLYVEGREPVHSAWSATCILPNRYNFPRNVPPRGTPFDCSNISTCHGECQNP